MGKSIRSKQKLRAKSIKRAGEFSKVVDDRNKRISDKLAKAKYQNANPDADAVKETESAAVAVEEQEQDEKMDEDKKPVSTSGWKNSRKSIYKQSLLKNKKKKNHLKF